MIGELGPYDSQEMARRRSDQRQATEPGKTTSSTVKTPAQKEAHNARCRESRLRTKRKREELENHNSEMQAQIQMMELELKRERAQNQRLQFDQNQMSSNMLAMGNEIKKLKNDHQILLGSFISIDKAVAALFALQPYQQAVQGSDDAPNITASATATATGPSLVANQVLPFVSDAPNNHQPAAGAAGPPLVAKDELLPFGFNSPNNDYNNYEFNDTGHGLTAGFPTTSASGPSFVGKEELLSYPNYNNYYGFNDIDGLAAGLISTAPVTGPGPGTSIDANDQLPSSGFTAPNYYSYNGLTATDIDHDLAAGLGFASASAALSTHDQTNNLPSDDKSGFAL